MRAVALFSGGLDSILAIKVISELGIDVEPVNFITPFNQSAEKLGEISISYKTFDLSDGYLEIVKSPRYGYGKNLNPCIACRILMYKKASQLMKEIGASFVVSGEVLGQRPMSQHKAAMDIIDRESGLVGLILRPLSAKLLPPTVPEEKGWVDRERLLDIQGRSRKVQIQMAEEYGIHEYFTPSGGCLLTDSGFSKRLKDLMEHNGLSLEEIDLLKVGRHFRISPKSKVVVGRNKRENDRLTVLAKPGDICFNPVTVKGPVGIGRGEFATEDVLSAGRIVARYCDGHTNGNIKINKSLWPHGRTESVFVSPMEDSRLEELRV